MERVSQCLLFNTIHGRAETSGTLQRQMRESSARARVAMLTPQQVFRPQKSTQRSTNAPAFACDLIDSLVLCCWETARWPNG